MLEGFHQHFDLRVTQALNKGVMRFAGDVPVLLQQAAPGLTEVNVVMAAVGFRATPLDQIHFFQADVLEPGWGSKPADIVCANILTSVLLDAAPLIKRAATKRILLSGIREIEADAVAETFIQLGCKEISRDGDGQWCGIVIDI